MFPSLKKMSISIGINGRTHIKTAKFKINFKTFTTTKFDKNMVK